ncbi:MAG: GNAT family N-acetyltransferase [Bacteroidales bacterium]|nr:GNAT family N-acetyltransferase [Bacteroidales bacterium]
MKSGEYLLIKATENNYDDYYKIRSEEKNLYWTGYEKAPQYENFKAWFVDRLNNPLRDIYLMYINEKCVGSLHIDFYDDNVAIGYSVMKSYEGKGIGTRLVEEAVKIAKLSKLEGKNILRVKAWINFQNVGSIKVIEKNGFHLTKDTELKKRFGKEELYYIYALTI